MPRQYHSIHHIAVVKPFALFQWSDGVFSVNGPLQLLIYWSQPVNPLNSFSDCCPICEYKGDPRVMARQSSFFYQRKAQLFFVVKTFQIELKLQTSFKTSLAEMIVCLLYILSVGQTDVCLIATFDGPFKQWKKLTITSLCEYSWISLFCAEMVHDACGFYRCYMLFILPINRRQTSHCRRPKAMCERRWESVASSYGIQSEWNDISFGLFDLYTVIVYIIRHAIDIVT